MLLFCSFCMPYIGYQVQRGQLPVIKCSGLEFSHITFAHGPLAQSNHMLLPSTLDMSTNGAHHYWLLTQGQLPECKFHKNNDH